MQAKDWGDFYRHDSDVRRHEDMHARQNRELQEIMDDTAHEYSVHFKADAILIRNVIMTRLSDDSKSIAQNIHGIIPDVYEWGGQPGMVADHLDELAKLLPGDWRTP